MDWLFCAKLCDLFFLNSHHVPSANNHCLSRKQHKTDEVLPSHDITSPYYRQTALIVWDANSCRRRAMTVLMTSVTPSHVSRVRLLCRRATQLTGRSVVVIVVTVTSTCRLNVTPSVNIRCRDTYSQLVTTVSHHCTVSRLRHVSHPTTHINSSPYSLPGTTESISSCIQDWWSICQIYML